METAEVSAELALCELLSTIVLAFTTAPEEVGFVARRKDDCVMIDVIASPKQLGWIIGKNWMTLQALRRILSTVAIQQNLRCELNVREAPSTKRAVQVMESHN